MTFYTKSYNFLCFRTHGKQVERGSAFDFFRFLKPPLETAQVMEALIEMARKFQEATNRGEAMGLTEDEIEFYDALATNESAVRELANETLKKIAHELTENLRQNLTVDWSERESVRAKLRHQHQQQHWRFQMHVFTATRL